MTSYDELVNIPSFGKKREDFKDERGEVRFYCKDCRKIVETTRAHPQKYIYHCDVCKGKNIAIGTEESLQDFYVRG